MFGQEAALWRQDLLEVHCLIALFKLIRREEYLERCLGKRQHCGAKTCWR